MFNIIKGPSNSIVVILAVSVVTVSDVCEAALCNVSIIELGWSLYLCLGCCTISVLMCPLSP